MNDTLRLLVYLSISGSIIAIILFAISPITKKYFPKAWHYYIWLIVVVRLLIPYSPQVNVTDIVYSKVDSLTVTRGIEDTTSQKALFQPYQNSETIVNKKESNMVMNSMKLFADNLFTIWIVVALMLFIRKATAYQSFVSYVKAGRRDLRDDDTLELFSQCCKERGIKVPPRLYANKLISSPMLVGIFKPFIVIPEAEMSQKHLQYIFLHELTHLKKLDILYKWLVELMVCIHWFNPIAYFVSKEINKACEFSCDESVLALFRGRDKKLYGDTLIYSLEISGAYKSQIVSVTLSEEAGLLKSRLKAIVNFNQKPKTVILASIILASILAFSSAWFGVYPASVAQNESVSISDKAITKADVDVCALEIMQRTGNWRYVEPLFPYMTSKGVENVVRLYIQKTNDFERTQAAFKYMNNTEEIEAGGESISINMTYEELAYELTDKTEDIYSSIVIFEFMKKDQVDRLVIQYMDKTKEIHKLYDIHTYMSTNVIDRVVLDYIEKTGDRDSIKGLIPFMSAKGAKQVSQ